MNSKISVVGAGHVGESVAFQCARLGLGDIVLVDVLPGVAEGKALDMLHAAAILGMDSKVTGTHYYSETAGSDVIVMTAGISRRPGMNREDLFYKNLEIVEDCVGHVSSGSPNAKVIVVTNPLNAMCEVARRASGFPSERVLGMAGILYEARMRRLIARELGVAVDAVSACVLGGLGDHMVPLPRYSTVSGQAITELLPAERVAVIVERTRRSGREIIELLKTGSAYRAPGLAAAEMVEAILADSHHALRCSAYLKGEFGIDGAFVGVPVRVGANGIEEIVELDLTPEELAALRGGAKAIERLLAKFPVIPA